MNKWSRWACSRGRNTGRRSVESPRQNCVAVTRQLREWWARRGSGRHLDTTMLLWGTPTAEVATAPAKRWATSIWLTQAHGTRDPAVLTHVELAEAWEAVATQCHMCLADTRGPVGAALCCLDRIGWSMPSPYVPITETGIAHDLALTSPSLVAKELRMGILRDQERRAAHHAGLGTSSGAIHVRV